MRLYSFGDVIIYKNAFKSCPETIGVKYNQALLSSDESTFILKCKKMFPKPMLRSVNGTYIISGSRKRIEEWSFDKKNIDLNVWPYQSGVALTYKWDIYSNLTTEVIKAVAGYQNEHDSPCSVLLVETVTYKSKALWPHRKCFYVYEVSKEMKKQELKTSLVKKFYDYEIPQTEGLLALSGNRKIIAFGNCMNNTITLHSRKSKICPVIVEVPTALNKDFFLQLSEDSRLLAVCGKENDAYVIYLYNFPEWLFTQKIIKKR